MNYTKKLERCFENRIDKFFKRQYDDEKNNIIDQTLGEYKRKFKKIKEIKRTRMIKRNGFSKDKRRLKEEKEISRRKLEESET